MKHISVKKSLLVLACSWGTLFFAAGQNYRQPVIPIDQTVFYTLTNGLTISMTPHPEVPGVFARVSLVKVPGDKHSQLLANLSFRWSAGIKAQGQDLSIADRLNAIGANFAIENGGISIAAAPDRTEALLEILRDFMLYFPDDEDFFQKVWLEWQQDARLAGESPAAIAQLVLDHWIYRDTFSEMAWLKDADRLPLLMKDCVGFMQDYFRMSNFTLGLVGLEPDKWEEDIKGQFSQEMPVFSPSTQVFVAPSAKGPQVALVQQEGSTAFFRLMIPAEVAPGTREAAALELLHTLFAGFPRSELNRQLARNFGLPLGMLSGITETHGQNWLQCSGNLPAKDIPIVGGLVIEKLLALKEAPVSEEALQQARQWLIRLKQRKLEQAAEVTLMTASKAQDSYSFDYHTGYAEMLNSITPAELLSLANRLLKKEQIRLFVIGDARSVASALAELDADNKPEWFNSMGEAIPSSFYDVPDGIRPETLLAQLATQHEWQTSELPVDNWHLDLEASLDGTPVKLEAYRSGTEKLLLQVKLDTVETNRIVSDGEGFQSLAFGSTQALDPLTETLLLLQPLLFPADISKWTGFEGRISGVRELESLKTWVLDLKTPEGFEFTAYVDAATGLLTGLKKQTEVQMFEMYYFDYVKREGLQVPERVVVKGIGPYPLVFRIVDFGVNKSED